MKLAIVCPNDLSKAGGVQQIALEMHKRLRHRGHESILVSVHPAEKLNLSHTRFFGTGLPISFNKASTDISFENTEDTDHLRNFLNNGNFDAVIVHHPQAPLLSLETLAYSPSVNIGWFHATTTGELNHNLAVELVQWILDSWLMTRLHGSIAVSPTVIEEWKPIFDNGDGVVITAGVDIERFSEAKKIRLGEDFNVLFVGRLDERKGVLEVIKAFELVAKKIPARLWIVGEGPDKEKAVEEVNKAGIREKVEFLGRVSDEELPSYYKSADVYVAPSLEGESLGIVLLEAMAAGVPVVAYANPGYKFTLKGNPWEGALVTPSHYKTLAYSILKIHGSKETREKVVNWQNEKVKEFDWERIIDQFLEYVKRVKVATGK